MQTSDISSSPWLDATSTNSTSLTFTSIAGCLSFGVLSAIRASFDDTQSFLDTPPLAFEPFDHARQRRGTGRPEPLTSADAPPSNAAAPAAIGSASAPPAARSPAAPAASYHHDQYPTFISPLRLEVNTYTQILDRPRGRTNQRTGCRTILRGRGIRLDTAEDIRDLCDVGRGLSVLGG